MIYKIKQKHTKHTTIYTMIKNGTKRIRKNVCILNVRRSDDFGASVKYLNLAEGFLAAVG
jgi:hypothetical protein